jgi:hypothetical protein
MPAVAEKEEVVQKPCPIAFLKSSLRPVPGTHLRIAKVLENGYRCNWYDPEKADIVKTMFVRVIQTPEGLVINDTLKQ